MPMAFGHCPRPRLSQSSNVRDIALLYDYRVAMLRLPESDQVRAWVPS